MTTTFSNLPANSTLTGTELFAISQSIAGVLASRKLALTDLQTFLKPLAGSPVTALSIASGVVNIDCSLGDYYTLSLTANVTSITFSNLPAAGRAETKMIKFTQDATGSRTVAIPSSLHAISGSDTAVQAAANAKTILAITTFNQGTTWDYSMKAGS